VKFINFDDFAKIKNVFSNFTYGRLIEMQVQFLPSKRLMLNEAVNLSYFVTGLQDSFYYIRYAHIIGFDVDSRPFDYGLLYTHLFINFYFSNFIFYKDGEKIIARDCVGMMKWFVQENEGDYIPGFFSFNGETGSFIDRLTFDVGTKYQRNTCSYIFIKAKVTALLFNEMSDTVIRRNALGFVRDYTLKQSIGSEVEVVWMSAYRLRLDGVLFDDAVFEKAKMLIIEGLTGIEPNVFRRIKTFKYLRLDVPNAREMFSHGMEWIQAMNNEIYVDLNNEGEIRSKFSNYVIIQSYTKRFKRNGFVNPKPYNYPEEDFCWYIRWPWPQLVFLDPNVICDMKVAKNCSCAQIYLLKYNHLLSALGSRDWFERTFFDPILSRNYNKDWADCNFTYREELCVTTWNGSAKLQFKQGETMLDKVRNCKNSPNISK
jgi:hypothetical protein